MPTPITFPRGALLTIQGSASWVLSDHNRSSFPLSFERVENTRRTARAVRRSYFIAHRRGATISWTKLPGLDANTIDGNTGANNLEAMFLSETAAVTLEVLDRGGASTIDYLMHITGFEKELQYRYGDDHYYNCSITLEQVS